jgi:hypothetical protein
MARRWTPAQIAALVIGAWWTSNGIAIFTIGDTNFATGEVHGSTELLGASVPNNGWHGILHLVPGLLGLAVCTRAEASRVYALAIGALYLIAAGTGFIAGGNSLGVISTDALGNTVHTVEGVIVLLAGIVSPRTRRGLPLVESEATSK